MKGFRWGGTGRRAAGVVGRAGLKAPAVAAAAGRLFSPPPGQPSRGDSAGHGRQGVCPAPRPASRERAGQYMRRQGTGGVTSGASRSGTGRGRGPRSPPYPPTPLEYARRRRPPPPPPRRLRRRRPG